MDDYLKRSEKAYHHLKEMEKYAPAFQKEWTSRTFYKNMIDNFAIAVFASDKNGDCLFCNDMWQKMTGLTQEEAKGDGWLDGIHPEDREIVEHRWYRACSLDLPIFISEHRYKNVNNGKVTPVLCIGYTHYEKLHDYKFIGTSTPLNPKEFYG